MLQPEMRVKCRQAGSPRTQPEPSPPPFNIINSPVGRKAWTRLCCDLYTFPSLFLQAWTEKLGAWTCLDSAWTVLGHILGTNRKGHPSEKQPHLLNVCHAFLRFFAFFFLANDVTPATLQKHPVTLPLSLPLSPSLSLSLSLPASLSVCLSLSLSRFVSLSLSPAEFAHMLERELRGQTTVC